MKSTNPPDWYARQEREARRWGEELRELGIKTSRAPKQPARPVTFADIQAAYREAAEYSRKDEKDNDRDD